MKGSILHTLIIVVWWQSACVSYICKYERKILYDTKVAQTLESLWMSNQIKCLHHVTEHVVTTWLVIYDPLNQ